MTQTPFDNLNVRKPGFWRRQFMPIPTPAQDKFDVLFAVVLPILVLAGDPIIFKGGGGYLGRPILENYQLQAYLVSTLEIGLFLTWRTFRLQLRAYAAVFAGFFFAATIFSMVIGIAIFPLSLVGLIVVVGAFGFIPFLTAFVFLRNGVRAARIQVTGATLRFRLSLALLSGALAIGLPMFTAMTIERSISSNIQMMVVGDATDAKIAATRLKRFRFIPVKYTEQLALAGLNETNPAKRQTIDKVYREITGEDLEKRRHPMFLD